ncbi:MULTISPECIES: hypothetical protein [Streptomyces]|uniref:Peptidase metallopeptidase domain-containing protein n=1 Tax=Streptomyces venezuelae TaxID=54571 RepID=A0A5P2AUX8_STRVZ|nr:hypothetical protein [Streptomyces venezuelae]QES22084.1 hypothetical protein DEJ46_25725 [Streptomyces venezuelae]
MELESLPDEVIAEIEVRDRWRRATAADGLEFLVTDIGRWPLGRTVRVAFLDGDDQLHADIAEATEQITGACNLTLDFGQNGAGTFRRWTTSDTVLAAEIRVSFDLPGFFSLVGTDSTDSAIGAGGGPVGGNPGQRSLNLGRFAVNRPPTWEGTVRHEFLHALGFHHSHQNMRGTCEGEFRWEDDVGYVPTQDPAGVFVPDAQGRRPGIYTYLAGEPNKWPRAKVDHNLRTVDAPDLVAGPFDTKSVMLYRFPAFFYKSTPSSCAPSGNGQNLSDGDKRGLDLLYPHTMGALADRQARADAVLESLGAGPEGVPGANGGDLAEAYRSRVEELAAAQATGVR